MNVHEVSSRFLVKTMAQPDDIARQLAALPGQELGQLRELWRRVFDRPAPAGLRRELMVRILGYRLQERAFGGLSRDAQRRLGQLAKMFATNPNAALPNVPAIKPGTRLIRTWQGQIHQVTVTDKGYEYKGRRYGSLSEIARLITGTRWSGPLFFGLRNGRAKESPNGR